MRKITNKKEGAIMAEITRPEFTALVHEWLHTITLDSLCVKALNPDNSLDLNDFDELLDVTRISPDFEISCVNDDVNIEKLVLPRKVNCIGEGAFNGTHIQQVVWPDACDIIHSSVFADSRLRRLDNISHVKAIEYGAFKGSDIESFIIPESINYIPEKFFYNCKN